MNRKEMKMETEYEKLIKDAETCWLQKLYYAAISYYSLALKEKQSGKITKKAVRQNIEELKKLKGGKID